MITSTGEPHLNEVVRTRARVVAVLGTRPEAIKLAPLLTLLGDLVETVHTGQHTDPDLTELHQDAPRPTPGAPAVMGLHRAEQISRTLSLLSDRWVRACPETVIVHGDTNTALAGALAANAVGAWLVHVEAGLRSHDRTMPEEHNRVLIDHLSDLCCAPTEGNVANLRAENIPDHRIALTGNTIVEAVLGCPRDPVGASKILSPYNGKNFVLATIHRPENTDHPHRLDQIIDALGRLGKEVIMPLHPRTRIKLANRQAKLPPTVRLVPPVAYSVFLELARRASLIVSDSGGVQEEAAVLARPLIVLRHSTERPEALGLACRLLSDPHDLPTAARSICAAPRWGPPQATPFGDGNASTRIANLVIAAIGGRQPAD